MHIKKLIFDPWVKLGSPALQADSLPSEASGTSQYFNTVQLQTQRQSLIDRILQERLSSWQRPASRELARTVASSKAQVLSSPEVSEPYLYLPWGQFRLWLGGRCPPLSWSQYGWCHSGSRTAALGGEDGDLGEISPMENLPICAFFHWLPTERALHGATISSFPGVWFQ